jgi:hypothetical protein
MTRKMYTYRVRVNGSEPLHKTIVVHADSDKAAEAMALTKITREWSSMYSPGKDTLQLELINTV